MGNLCFKEEKQVRYEGVNDVPDWDERRDREMVEEVRREIIERENQKEEEQRKFLAKVREMFQASPEQLEKRERARAKRNASRAYATMRAVPRRRIRLSKTAAKRKSKTTRSQYGKRKNRKH